VGVGYYQINPHPVQGDARSRLNNIPGGTYDYHYNFSSSQVLLESKFLTSFGRTQAFHPYLSLGAGAAFNRITNFSSRLVSGEEAPMRFANGSNTVFSYMAGVGIDVDLSKQWRLGLGYRYVDFGQAFSGRGSAPEQFNPVPIALRQEAFRAHEFLLQVGRLF
jgi:opacity protein-like surface antigen